MKVLIVCPRLCHGGAERVAVSLANGLRENFCFQCCIWMSVVIFIPWFWNHCANLPASLKKNVWGYFPLKHVMSERTKFNQAQLPALATAVGFPAGRWWSKKTFESLAKTVGDSHKISTHWCKSPCSICLSQIWYKMNCWINGNTMFISVQHLPQSLILFEKQICLL